MRKPSRLISEAASGSEKGQVWALTLMVLAASSLLVVPTMSWGSTSLRSSNAAQQRVQDRYSSDAGVEHALWRLQYQSGFSNAVVTPVAYSQSVNGRSASITVIAVATPVPPTPTPTPTPSGTSGGHISIVSQVSPSTITPYQATTFTYTLYIQNYGTSKVHLDDVGDLLPSTFSYVAGSVTNNGITKGSGNITLGAPAITIVNGQQQLLWSFSTPKPYVESGVTAVVTLKATATPAPGTYLNDAWVDPSPDTFGTITASTGFASPVLALWPTYDIISTAGKVTTKARAELQTSGAVIKSWQVQ